MADTIDASTHAQTPADAVRERLDDPTVAASLVTLLDNAELLSTLVLGLSGFVERGDFIMDAVADGVKELKTAGGGQLPIPNMSELGAVTHQLSEAAPVLTSLLESSIVSEEAIGLLSLISSAATEGAERARAADTQVGALGLAKALRDDDVQRGVGLIIEVARSLGQKLQD